MAAFYPFTSICRMNHSHTTDCTDTCVGNCLHTDCKEYSNCEYMYTGKFPHFTAEFQGEMIMDHKNGKMSCRYLLNGRDKCIFLEDEKHREMYDHLSNQFYCFNCNKEFDDCNELKQSYFFDKQIVLCENCLH